MTAKWRQENVLVQVRLELDGPVVDLFDADARQELEDRHAALLVEYGLEHLDLSEITTKRRKVTQGRQEHETAQPLRQAGSSSTARMATNPPIECPTSTPSRTSKCSRTAA